METIIGFLAGYLIGSREGKQGLERLRSSARAIINSPEVRRMAGEALSLAEQVTHGTPAPSVGAVGGNIVRTLTNRVSGGRQPDAGAA